MASIEKNVKSAAQSAAGDRRGGSAPEPEARSALGNNTKLQAAFRDLTCPESGVVTRFALDPKRREYRVETPREDAVSTARNARFSAQTAATKLLFNRETPREGQWRVTGCHRRKISEEVAVLHSSKINKAHYGGLMVCGSVWCCPACAAKISERRKREIEAAANLHKAQGGGLAMLTLTFPHYRADSLGGILGMFGMAKIKMRAHRGYKNLKAEMGLIGDIRALEVTYGDANGFHPHEHCLWLTEKPLTTRQLAKVQRVIYTLWSRACVASGLPQPNRKRGVNVKAFESPAEYLAKFGREPKWGVGSELAKQHTKTGSQGAVKSYTPFDLLRAYENGETRFGPLFIEFAEAFFGKNQVRWSDGLKKLFGIAELSDREIAAKEDQEAAVVVRITGQQWKAVIRQKVDRRGAILDLAERAGFEGVQAYLASLPDVPKVEVVSGFAAYSS